MYLSIVKICFTRRIWEISRVHVLLPGCTLQKLLHTGKLEFKQHTCGDLVGCFYICARVYFVFVDILSGTAIKIIFILIN